MVTNYLCGSGYQNYRYCCPAFFMMKGDSVVPLLEKYYRRSFVTTFKAEIPVDTQLKWQDGGSFDIKLWEAWRQSLKTSEDEIKAVIFSDENK
jgi:hypothetical protein